MRKPYDLAARKRIEEEFHDEKARKGVDDFYRFGALDAADEYLWNSLGDLAGKKVLEIGCGEGFTAIKFARQGAAVTGIDISSEMVEHTKRRAQENRVGHNVRALHMGGEDLDFPEGCFDIIYGHSILHHLHLDIAAPKIARVLGQGGSAAFLEPLNYNPFLNAFRLLTPHRRTPTEKPLSFPLISAVSKHFGSWDHREFYLLSLSAFVWYYGVRNENMFRRTQSSLLHVDEWLFRMAPALRRLAWVTVLRFMK